MRSSLTASATLAVFKPVLVEDHHSYACHLPTHRLLDRSSSLQAFCCSFPQLTPTGKPGGRIALPPFSSSSPSSQRKHHTSLPPSFFPTPHTHLSLARHTTLSGLIHSCGREDAQPGKAYTLSLQEQVWREERERSRFSEGVERISLPQIQCWVCYCECLHSLQRGVVLHGWQPVWTALPGGRGLGQLPGGPGKQAWGRR